jgi:hypothetical protein
MCYNYTVLCEGSSILFTPVGEQVCGRREDILWRISMLVKMWRRASWASALAGLALLAGVASTTPRAMAAPLQAPPVAKSCKDFEAPNRTAIKLAGVKYNDSCIVAVIHGCDLQVDLVVNAEVRANLKSFTWDRRVNRTGMSKPYSKTANTTAYGYKRRTVNIWQSQLYPDIPGCSKKRCCMTGRPRPRSPSAP